MTTVEAARAGHTYVSHVVCERRHGRWSVVTMTSVALRAEHRNLRRDMVLARRHGPYRGPSAGLLGGAS